MNRKFLYVTVIAVLLIICIVLCTSVVRQGSMAVILRFGKPVKIIKEPGLYVRLPYPISKVAKFDARLTLLQPKPSEFLTADKKNLILENSICYRIVDPVMFMRTVRDQQGVEVRLADLLASHTGLLLGVRELSEIVNTDTTRIHFREMNEELTELMRRDSEDLGIEVKEVFIKRIMLPYQNVLAVYNRMRAERDRIAKKYLAEGEEQALGIRAEADRESRTLIAGARKEADIIKGNADAEAMKIYGGAYSRNPEFFRFLRSLEAYEKMFNDKSVIILDEKSDILKTLFNNGNVEK
jgi:membrane protease subunit HflC